MNKCLYNDPEDECDTEIYGVAVPGNYVYLMCFAHAKDAWQWDSWRGANDSQSVVRYLSRHSTTRHLFNND